MKTRTLPQQILLLLIVSSLLVILPVGGLSYLRGLTRQGALRAAKAAQAKQSLLVLVN